jgi:hypothetical protein
MASNRRTTPDVAGFVTRISADLNRGQQGNSGQPAPAY